MLINHPFAKYGCGTGVKLIRELSVLLKGTNSIVCLPEMDINSTSYVITSCKCSNKPHNPDDSDNTLYTDVDPDMKFVVFYDGIYGICDVNDLNLREYSTPTRFNMFGSTLMKLIRDKLDDVLNSTLGIKIRYHDAPFPEITLEHNITMKISPPPK